MSKVFSNVLPASKWNAQLRFLVALDAVEVAVHLLQILGQSLLVGVQALAAHLYKEVLAFAVGTVALVGL